MTFADRAFIKAFAGPVPRGHLAARRVQAAEALAGDTAAVAHAAHAPLPQARTIGHVSGSKQPSLARLAPLSTFAAEPRGDEPLRAGIEVERFTFSSACDALYVQASRASARFLDELVESAWQGQKCLAVTSTHRGEGRTTILLTVARHLAARGMRGLVVDADFENPSLASSCGLTAYTGWGDVLRSELPLGEALVGAIDDGLTIMPWHGSAVRVADLCGWPGAAARLGMLRDHFDFVLVDPVNISGQTAASELASFAELIRVDATYLVQDVRWTLAESLRGTCTKLRRAGLRVQAIIENFQPLAGGAESSEPIHSHPRASRALASNL